MHQRGEYIDIQKSTLHTIGEVLLKNEKTPTLLTLEIRKHGLFTISDKEGRIVIKGGIDMKRSRAGIQHILLREDIRHIGNGPLIMNRVEASLQEIGIKEIFVAFRIHGTLDFFIKCGYHIVEASALTYEEMMEINFTGITLEEHVDASSYEQWKQKGSHLDTGGKILLRKVLT